MTPRYVLDTNIFTALLRHEPHTLARVIRATQDEVDLLLCPIVFYEVYRGLRYRDAQQQLDFFLNYVTTFIRDEFNSDDWQQAGQLWADLRRQGQPTGDIQSKVGGRCADRLGHSAAHAVVLRLEGGRNPAGRDQAVGRIESVGQRAGGK